MKINGNNITSVQFSQSASGALTEYPVVDLYNVSTGGTPVRWVYNIPYTRQNPLPTGIASLSCMRTSSRYKLASSGNIPVNSLLYFGDNVELAAQAATGYAFIVAGQETSTYTATKTVGLDRVFEGVQKSGIGTEIPIRRLTYDLDLVVNTGVSRIYYKLGSGDSWHFVTSSTILKVYYGIECQLYAVAEPDFELTGGYENYDEDNPAIITKDTTTQYWQPAVAIREFIYTQGVLPKINNLTCIASFVCVRDFSWSGNTGTVNDGEPLYSGDKLHWEATVDAPYNAPTYKYSAPSSYTVVGGINGVQLTEIRTTVKTFTLSYVKNTHVSSISMNRESSPYQGAATGPIASGSVIYYGDELEGVAQAEAYYHFGSSNLQTTDTYTNIGATGNVSWSPTVTLNSYIYSIGTLPQNIASLSCYRDSSLISGLSNTVADGGIIYAQDKLHWGATANTGYGASLQYTQASSYTVIDDVTGVTVTEVEAYRLQWKLVITKGDNMDTVKYRINGGADIEVTDTATLNNLDYDDSVLVWGTAESEPQYNYSAVTGGGTFRYSSVDQLTNVTCTKAVKSFTFTLTKSNYVESISLSRTESPYQHASTGILLTSTGTVTIYYGDKLSGTATSMNNFHFGDDNTNTTTTYNNIGVTGPDSWAPVAVANVFAYTQGTLPTGVNSLTCIRAQSPYGGGGSSIVGGIIYYGDKLYWTATPITDYEITHLDYSSASNLYEVTGDVEGVDVTNIEADIIDWSLTIIKGPYMASVSYTKNGGTPVSVTDAVTISNLTSSDTIVVSGVKESEEPYNYGAITGAGTFQYSNPVRETTVTCSREVKSYNFTLTKMAHVYSVKIWRESSPYAHASTSTSSQPMLSGTGTVTVYYGDVIKGVASADSGYSISGSANYNTEGAGITGNTSWAPSATPRSYTYRTDTTGKVPTNCTFTCYRINSPAGIVPNGGTVYYGDQLYWVFTAPTGATSKEVSATYNYSSRNDVYTVSGSSSGIVGSTVTSLTVTRFVYSFTLRNDVMGTGTSTVSWSGYTSSDISSGSISGSYERNADKTVKFYAYGNLGRITVTTASGLTGTLDISGTDYSHSYPYVSFWAIDGEVRFTKLS